MPMSEKAPMRTPCRKCPLRAREAFKPLDDDELAFMESFKSGELHIDRGTTIVSEGTRTPHLFTILDGAAVRYKTTEDGRRQVIGFGLPGDFIGLQSAVMDEMQHTVEAATRMRLCVFGRGDFFRLFEAKPERGFDVAWLAAREEYFLGDHLLTVGRRSAIERVAFGLHTLHKRALSVGMATRDSMAIPFTQQDLADALGLSLVHTNKTLKRLRERGVVSWAAGVLEIKDAESLAALAGAEEARDPVRPLM